ncbi:MAG: PAS domain S-box protein, partial [Bacteroidota bacterium]
MTDKEIIKKLKQEIAALKKKNNVLIEFKDITWGKQTFETLKKSEAEYRTLAEKIDEGLVLVNKKEDIIFINPAGCRMFGYSKEELIGKNLEELFPLESFKEIKRQTRNRRKGETGRYEITIIRKDGTERILMVTASPMLDERGKYKGGYGLIQDITGQKLRDAELRNSKELIETVMDNVSDDISLIDVHNYEIASANKTFLKKYNLKKEELTGKTCYKITHNLGEPCKPPDDICPLIETEKTGQTKRVVHRHIDAKGRKFYCEISTSPVKNDKGEVYQVVHAARDISIQKKAEEEILRLNKILSTFYLINQDIIIETDINKLLNKICERIVRELDIRFVWIGTTSNESYDVEPIAQAGFEKDYLKKIRITYDTSEHGRGPTGTAISTKKPSVMRFIDTDKRFKPWRKQALQRGYRSSASFPMITSGKCVGALNLYSPEPDAFGKKEIDLFGTLAGDIAIALKTAKKEEALRESEERFKRLSDATEEAVAIHDSGKILEVNKTFWKMFGYKEKEVVGMSALDLAAPESRELILKNIITGYEKQYEAVGLRKDGSSFYIELTGKAIPYKDKKARVTVVRDITERKRTEETLKEREEHYRDLFELSPIGNVTCTLDGKFISANQAFVEMMCYSKKELYKMTFMDITHPDDTEISEKMVKEIVSGKILHFQLEKKYITKKGKIIECLIKVSLVKDIKGNPVSTIGQLIDITELKQAEKNIMELNEELEQKVIERTAQLEVANEEIKVLLSEMHHRVKNNLQIISSLLNLQSASIKNKELSKALKDSQDRIETMALIHETLYQKRTLSRINLNKYLENLIKDRIKANSNMSCKVECKIDIPGIDLKINTMVPIGLLINELVTNSLKHAFLNMKKGLIDVNVKKIPGNKYNIQYSDNGVGFSKDTGCEKSKTLGIELIDSFITQIDGSFTRKS